MSGPVSGGRENPTCDPTCDLTSAERAELLHLGEVYNWPTLELRQGEVLGAGRVAWERFAEFANGRLSEALDAARRHAERIEQRDPF